MQKRKTSTVQVLLKMFFLYMESYPRRMEFYISITVATPNLGYTWCVHDGG